MAPPRRAPQNPSAAGAPAGPVVLVAGTDEFQVKARARQIHDAWLAETPDADDEIIPAKADTVDEVQAVLRRAREAMQSLSLFGSAKVIWLQDVNWLGENARLSGFESVTEAVKDWEAELKAFPWEGVRLLISAGKVDGRRTFGRTIQKIGQVETFASLAETRDWASQAADWVAVRLREAGKRLPEPALQQLIDWVGPDRRALSLEVDKLILYAGDRRELTAGDVEAIISRGRRAEDFALAEAVAQRNLPQALQRLDDELWSLRQSGSGKSAVGLLMSLASQFRVLLLVKEAVRRGLLPARASYNQVKAALAKLPTDLLPSGDPYNLARIHPFRVSRALGYLQRYSMTELREGLRLLRDALRRLMSSGVDSEMLIETTVLRILGPESPGTSGRPPTPAFRRREGRLPGR
ncbi:MAG: DNA polymerase III subunit delta [Verrucomicrobia bacterium]|nr:MAG: DNA polymerase III subunit delta [Verrucomicrobiota bacterium]